MSKAKVRKVVKRTTLWVLGDQLTPKASLFQRVDRGESVVLLVESLAKAGGLPFHKQKLVLVWSAMRHFADELRNKGWEVDYYRLQPNLAGGLVRHLRKYKTSVLRLMESAEHGVSDRLARIARSKGLSVRVTPNNMFLSDRDEFVRDAQGKKTLLLESFYRNMRRRTGLLMDGNDPVGAKWNFDRENRQTPPKGHVFPEVPRFKPDATTQALIKEVNKRFPGHFGTLDGFSWPVTRRDAARFLQDFLDKRLDLFGPYEDAIVVGESTLYHSRLSPLLNIGLLEPMEACRKAEKRFRSGRARINSTEGFIRQIIGWREFIYQVYRLHMPDYRDRNHFDASVPLPDFYWTGETDMHCVADAVQSLRKNGINHHIQRLMVTGNFALIAGIQPWSVNEWYWSAYVDAFEWVVTPNVLGLALYADGGILATKPYAASANYIKKMSDACARCPYDPKKTVEEGACPFNALYWDFLYRHRKEFRANPRMNMMMALLKKRPSSVVNATRRRASKTRRKIGEQERL